MFSGFVFSDPTYPKSIKAACCALGPLGPWAFVIKPINQGRNDTVPGVREGRQL